MCTRIQLRPQGKAVQDRQAEVRPSSPFHLGADSEGYLVRHHQPPRPLLTLSTQSSEHTFLQDME